MLRSAATWSSMCSRTLYDTAPEYEFTSSVGNSICRMSTLWCPSSRSLSATSRPGSASVAVKWLKCGAHSSA